MNDFDIYFIGLEAADGSIEYYAVRSVVEERINQQPAFIEAEILGRLHASNAKKIGLPHAQAIKSLTKGVTYEYSISDFLQDVKGVFDDTFSNDVYTHLGTQRATSDFSANLLYSTDDDSVSNRSLLANALESVAQNDIERNKLNEYKSKIALIESEQAKLSEIRKKILGIK